MPTRRSKPNEPIPLTQWINIGMLVGLGVTSSVAATIEWVKWLQEELEPSVIIELDNVMEQVKQTAYELCPKDTRALANSINLISGAITEGDFANYQLFAGDESINPKTLKPTSEYAFFVEEGHLLKDNVTWWEGAHFLSQAMQIFEEELSIAVERALREMGATE